MKEEHSSTPGYDTVVIRNLPLDCNRQVLREGFGNCGSIKFAEMQINERGSGIIRFDSPRGAERAVGESQFIVMDSGYPT